MERLVYEEKELTYDEKCRQNDGILVIKGVDIPSFGNFNPLARIWETVRETIIKKYEVDIIGSFVYNDYTSTVHASFWLNYNIVGAAMINDYTKKFKEAFPAALNIFKAIFEKFMLEPEGFSRYKELAEDRESEIIGEEYKLFFDNFVKNLAVAK